MAGVNVKYDAGQSGGEAAQDCFDGGGVSCFD
jgi:hypothetical protein